MTPVSEYKLPPDSPGLKLILALLQQRTGSCKTDHLADWIMLYTCSGALQQLVETTPDEAMATSVFSAVSKLFMDEIHQVCTAASPERDTEPLTRYLTCGRGLLLLTALVQTAGANPTFNGELGALLLSLATFLKPEEEEKILINKILKVKVEVPDFDSLSISTQVSKPKKTRNMSRPTKAHKRRSSRPTCLPGFPEVTVPSPGQVCENLAQWEGSPSSEGEVESASIVVSRDTLVKYIPVNYFAYFDNANLDSDEVTGESVRTIPRPPPLPGPPMKVSANQAAMLALGLVCRLTRMGSQTLQPQDQAALIQLAMVATSQLKVRD